jgi:phosphoribosylanthranilate isomerase
MTLVKICGIRTTDAAQAAIDAGADYLGFIFAPSRRQVSAGTVAAIRSDLEPAGKVVPLVGVFVDPDPAELTEIVAESGIDVVQLSGEEAPDAFATFPTPIFKAIPAGSNDTAGTIGDLIDAWAFARHILLDASDPTARGGTGKLANWDLAAQVAKRHSILLAGGLNPDNVSEAITSVRPDGVDVSSGVERDGAKDPALICSFLERVRA